MLNEEEPDTDDEEEPEDIQMDTFHEEEPGVTAEEVSKKQDVNFRRTGQSYNVTIEARDALECGPHLGCLECKYITGEVATQSSHSRECKIRIMVEMEKNENKCRLRKNVAKGTMVMENQAKEARQKSESQE